MSIRDEVASDLSEILEDPEDPAAAGTPFSFIDREGNEYPVMGAFGDIGYLLNPENGIPVQGRTITASYRMALLRELTEKVPEQGWKVKIHDLNGIEQIFYVSRYEPDRTLGIGRVKLTVKP
jgi:hypothetical protein